MPPRAASSSPAISSSSSLSLTPAPKRSASTSDGAASRMRRRGMPPPIAGRFLARSSRPFPGAAGGPPGVGAGVVGAGGGVAAAAGGCGEAGVVGCSGSLMFGSPRRAPPLTCYMNDRARRAGIGPLAVCRQNYRCILAKLCYNRHDLRPSRPLENRSQPAGPLSRLPAHCKTRPANGPRACSSAEEIMVEETPPMQSPPKPADPTAVTPTGPPDETTPLPADSGEGSWESLGSTRVTEYAPPPRSPRPDWIASDSIDPEPTVTTPTGNEP